jgi:hypothetical protein
MQFYSHHWCPRCSQHLLLLDSLIVLSHSPILYVSIYTPVLFITIKQTQIAIQCEGVSVL